MAVPVVLAKVFDSATTTASKFFPDLVSPGICILAGAWVLDSMPNIPPLLPHGLSPSELIGQATRLAGYPHPQWLTDASAWIRDSPRSQTINAVTPFVAGCLACLAKKAALAAWVLLLVAVEAAGTHAAGVHTAVLTLVVAVIIVLLMVACDEVRMLYAHKRNMPACRTWPGVAGYTLGIHLVVIASPVVLVGGLGKLLLDTWLDPDDSSDRGEIVAGGGEQRVVRPATRGGAHLPRWPGRPGAPRRPAAGR